jgi:glycosyltransferase involved in cell wall biosynthesis
MPLVSISNHQREPTPPLNWLGTVYHGLPTDLYPFNASPSGDYFAFLGRISPEKRLDRAIEVARRAGVALKVAAKVDKADQAYFEEDIAPLLDAAHVQLVGEIGDERKADFLANARGLLFPIDWPEPFGLVMIEAMCCGTPVIAWRCGAVPEVVDAGVSGFIVQSIDEAVQAVHDVSRLRREKVRRQFERRFSAERMARDYVSIYQALLRRCAPYPGEISQPTR